MDRVALISVRGPHVGTRAYRRLNVPAGRFRLGVLVPLILVLGTMLFGVTRFANSWIERTAAENMRAALDAAGHQWARVDISGQIARLSGAAPSSAAGADALSIARGAKCPTWLGPKTCAVSVGGFFGTVDADIEPVAEKDPAACQARLADLQTDARIEFASGRADLIAAAAPLLDEIAAVASTCPGTIRIEGHTDARGDPDANRALSQARAETVRDALTARGVAPDRLLAVGIGQDDPVASNATAEGRARNRRIEFRVTVPGG